MGEQLKLDVGVADVHVGASKSTASSALDLTAAQRKKLKPSQFADPQNRAYPVQDKAHADNAAARLEQQKGSMSPGKYASIKRKIKAAQKRFGEKANVTATASPVAKKPQMFHLRMSNGKGGFTSIRHQMSASEVGAYGAAYDDQREELLLYVPLDKAQALSADTPDGRVWIQIAKTGAWAGHPQGAFQITEQTLDALARNFHGQGVGRLQYDFNHASAYPPNSGTIPETGTPAQGWFYDVQRQGDKLFALTQWLPKAKEYIENDQYGGVSPLINWKGVDRVTGKPIGPELRSVALTNLPFLLGMQRPTAASADGPPTKERGLMPLTELPAQSGQSLDAYCWMSAGQMLPQLKKVLGLHELSTAKQCSDALSNLGVHLDAVDGDATAKHEGIDLGGYVANLRELVGESAEMSSVELIQFIDKILDEYMAENGIEDDDSTNGMTASSADVVVDTDKNPPATEQPVATAASTEGAIVAEPQVPPEVVTDPATVAASVATDPVVPAATVTAASAAVEPAPALDASLLVLKLAEAEARIAELESKNQSLSADATVTAEQALSAEVESAFVTYKDIKGLKPEHKVHMLSVLKSTPDAFHAMYPAVAPEHQHLLSHLTGGGAANPTAPGARVEADTATTTETTEAQPNEHQQILALGINGLTDKIMADEKLSFTAAQLKADRKIREATQALSAQH